MTFAIEKAPHLRNPRSTRGIMLELTVSLLVIFAYSLIWYFLNAGTAYGVHAILIFVIAVLSSVLADALWAIPALKDKKVPSVSERLKNWGLAILDSYGWVSGVILALLMPIGGDWHIYYVTFVSAFIGTFLAKSLFGGFGKNIFNPAIIGRVFAQLCFASDLKTYITAQVVSKPDTIATGASITSLASGLGWTTNFTGISLLDLFLGNYRGTLGETFAFLILAAAIILSIRKVIDWRTPVTYVGTFFLTALFIGFGSGLGGHAFEYALRNVMMGGVLFGGVFCLTDPVTGPTSRVGKVINAAVCALLTALIRYKAAAPEGVAYSILLCNMLTPLIGRLLLDKSNQHHKAKYGAIGGLVVVSLVFGVLFGVYHKTTDKYNSGVARYDQDQNFYSLVLANTSSASSYKVEASPTLKNATCLKKMSLVADGEPTAYYELATDTTLSYNYTKGKTGVVNFSILVNKNGTVAYKYISSTENGMGTGFAQQISITKDHSYLKGSLSAEQVLSTPEVENSSGTGATSASRSIYTVKAILKAIKAAENDFGLDVNDPIDNLNALLTAQNIAELTSSQVNTGAGKDLTSGKVNALLNGFQVNSKDAAFYDVTSLSSPSIRLSVLVDGDGVVGASVNPFGTADLGTEAESLNTLVKSISLTAPYAADKAVTSTGAVLTAETMLHEVIADFAIADIAAPINALLDAQSLAHVSSSDLVVATNPTIAHGSVSLKYTGFKVNEKDAAFYDVLTNGVDASQGTEEGDNMVIHLNLIANADGIVAASYLTQGTSDLQMGETELINALKLITVSNPFTATSVLGNGSVDFTGATITKGMTSYVLNEVLTDFVGAAALPDVSGLNALLTAQSLTNVTGGEVTEATIPTIKHGVIAKKLTGFKANGKDAAFYDVSTNGVDASQGAEEGDNMVIHLNLLLNSDGIIGASYLTKGTTDLQMGETELINALKLITVSAPFTATSVLGNGSVDFTGATITKGMATYVLDEVIAEFGGN